MLEINYIEENKAHVIKRLEKRNLHDAADKIEQILAINQQRKETQLALDTASSQVNQITKQIEQLLETKNKEKLESLKAQSRALKTGIKELESQLNRYKDVLQHLLYELPNLPHEKVPIGKDATENQIVYQVENIPLYTKDKLPHWELVAKFDIIDFDLGNKLTGAGFPVYKGKGARLQRALINFFLDEAIKAGYEEIQPPILVNKDSAYGTGQLPDKEGQMYELVNEPLYLIPTAEVPVTNLYRGQILSEDKLPIRHVAYTPCFRREAGSWGSHVRGLNRLHQFDKVEIVQITLPEISYQTLEGMRSYVESLVQKLELPYRVVALCGGDLGFTSAFTYDIEVFSVGQNRWLEVSSISNFETYQANRMQLRYKNSGGFKHLLHTLNGSAIALPRIMAALLELNFVEGKIKIPTILRNYTGFDYIS
ncbi:MAG: serine--tRNA ligase [Candidatus Amoebophilus sp. 36-38]|nr:MAG: serine--tRNA ligase [Candidatus Amoebophilus sp. 36-38]